MVVFHLVGTAKRDLNFIVYCPIFDYKTVYLMKSGIRACRKFTIVVQNLPELVCF